MKIRYLLYVRPRKGSRRYRNWPRGMKGVWAGVTVGGQGWAYAKGDEMSAEKVEVAKKIFRDCYGAGFEFKTEKVK